MAKDISGGVYGDLKALSIAEKSPNGDFYWNCSCSCGNLFKVSVGRLNYGSATSCGCKTFEKMSKVHRTHGMTRTPEYKSWCKMRERCMDTENKDYPEYGAVGIFVEDAWKTSFDAFYDHIGPKPDASQRYTIDRIDNNGSYTIGNVRWATDTQQARNKGKQVNNSSGSQGVVWDLKVSKSSGNSALYAGAIWSSLDGSGQKKKSFSVKTYGLLPAFTMACQYRDKMIFEFNEAGAGYSENHGK